MKKIISIIVIILCIIGVTGCKKEKRKANIKMNCDDTITTFEIKEGNKISCKLLGDNYEFTVNKITDDKIELEVDKYGLNDGAGIIKKIKSFTIDGNDELKIHTNTTDHWDYVTFQRK